MLHDLLQQSAQAHPERAALIFRDQMTTYAALRAQVEALGQGLRAVGIVPGDKIGLLLPNCPPFVVAYYAATRIGAIAVPANPLLKPAELEMIWGDSQVTLVVTVAPLLPSVEAARANLPGLRFVVVADEDITDATASAAASGAMPLDALMERGRALLALQASEDAAKSGSGGEISDRDGAESNSARDENDCAVIIYTSGTTGRPKGAMLSHKNLTRNVEQVLDTLHFLPDDCLLTVLPLFHAFAATVCMNVAIGGGCRSVLLENFVPARAWDALQRHKVTILPAVPAIFHALLQTAPDPMPELPALRMLVSGGAPLPAATLEALEQRFGAPVLEGDGPTECSPVTSVNPLDGPRKVGSVGPPMRGVEIAIFDDNDQPLPADAIGEIVVRGDNVMLGYWNQPEATREAMRGGWYHTGDVGRQDADGYVFITDRKKDMIITSGLNVYPREVEDVLLTHPAVADCAVIGLPDAARGEAVTAVVIARPGVSVTERELAAHCRQRLANYKTPRQVLFRETLPRGATGKVVKRLLKKELELETSAPS